MGVGVHGAGGPGAGGVSRGSGTCLRGGAFGWRVCWALHRPVRCAMAWAGLRVGLCPLLPGGLPAEDRVWTRRVFGVAEPGFLRGLGLVPRAGVRCQGVALVGCLLPPYSWGWARPRSRHVTRGSPGSL